MLKYLVFDISSLDLREHNTSDEGDNHTNEVHSYSWAAVASVSCKENEKNGLWSLDLHCMYFRESTLWFIVSDMPGILFKNV